MNCDDVRSELIEYHFGLLEERTALEQHLSECRACLEHFFELKRAVEQGEGSPGPSAQTRARLRAAVADELRPKHPVRRSWWERPVAVALAASVVLVAGVATRAITTGPGSPPYAVQQDK